MFTGLFQGANAAEFQRCRAVVCGGFTPPEGMYTGSALSNRTVFRYLRYSLSTQWQLQCF